MKSEDLSEIDPGTYEVYDYELPGDTATYEIRYCDEEGEAGWRYLYYLS